MGPGARFLNGGPTDLAEAIVEGFAVMRADSRWAEDGRR
jgi:hypothetical protein